MAGSYTLTDSTERSGTTTVTSIATGTAASDRISVFMALANPLPSAISFNGISIPMGLTDGGGGTQCVIASIGGGTYMILGWCLNTSGTTASLVCTGASSTYNFGCFAVNGCDPQAFHLNGAITTSTTLDNPLDGVKIAYGVRSGTTNLTWSNITERFDYNVVGATARASGAADLTSTRAVAQTITCTTALSVLAVSFCPTPQTIVVTPLTIVTHTGGGTSVSGTIDVGAADSTKQIVACYAWYTGGLINTTGGTIDSVADDHVDDYDYGTERNGGFVKWSLPSSSGTVNWQIDADSDIWNGVVSLYKVIGADDTVVGSTSDTSGAISMTVTTANEGVAFANIIGFNPVDLGSISGGYATCLFDDESALVMKTSYRRVIASSNTTTDSMNDRIGGAMLTLGPTSGGTNVSVDVTGQSVTASVGTVGVNVPVSVTGQSVTASVGTVTVSLPKSTTVTGQSVTASVGTVATSGRANVSPTGQSVTVSVGSVTVSLPKSTTVTGQSVTASVGTVTVVIPASVSVTGQSVTASVGSVAVETDQIISVTGQSVTASVGTVTVNTGGNVSVNVTGQSVTASVGTVTATGRASTTVTGQAVTVGLGNETVTTGATTSVTGQAVTTSVGTVTVSTGGNVSVNVTGQEVTVSVGTVMVTTDEAVIVYLTTPEAMVAEVGAVTVPTWQPVNPPDPFNWNSVTGGGNPWTPVDRSTAPWNPGPAPQG